MAVRSQGWAGRAAPAQPSPDRQEGLESRTADVQHGRCAERQMCSQKCGRAEPPAPPEPCRNHSWVSLGSALLPRSQARLSGGRNNRLKEEEKGSLCALPACPHPSTDPSPALAQAQPPFPAGILGIPFQPLS